MPPALTGVGGPDEDEFWGGVITCKGVEAGEELADGREGGPRGTGEDAASIGDSWTTLWEVGGG